MAPGDRDTFCLEGTEAAGRPAVVVVVEAMGPPSGPAEVDNEEAVAELGSVVVVIMVVVMVVDGGVMVV